MKMDEKRQEEIKKKLGAHAATLIQDGMLVGLGSGSTASFFIESLILRCRQGLKIKTVSSSLKSLEMAKKGGIPCMEMDQVTEIDLTVDGADEIDPKWRMIKGGGGAHVREKILASTSKEMLVLVDESKLVKQLGKCGLPLEIIPFGFQATIRKLEKKGFTGNVRKDKTGAIHVTDNGNYLFDIHSPPLFDAPEQANEIIKKIPGVVDTGFFFNMATSVLVGFGDLTIKTYKDSGNGF